MLKFYEITRSRTPEYVYKIFFISLLISPRYSKLSTRKSTRRLLRVRPVVKKMGCQGQKFVDLGFLYMNYFFFF